MNQTKNMPGKGIVLFNPIHYNSKPSLHYAPGNGWAIKQGEKKGCHLPDLWEAIEDWNASARRDLDLLPLGGAELDSLHFGRLKNYKQAAADFKDSHKLPGWGCVCPECLPNILFDLKNTPEPAKPDIAHGLEFKTSKPLLPGMMLLAMMEAMLGLEELGAEATLQVSKPSEAMAKLLASRGRMTDKGIVISPNLPPGMSPDEFSERLRTFIELNNLEAVEKLLSGKI